MEKVIWVASEKREDLLDVQRKINAHGGMKAMCILNAQMLKKIIEERVDKGDSTQTSPSLIIMDYHIIKEDENVMTVLKLHPKLAGVPLFFMVDENDFDSKEECYQKGAMVVLDKPIKQSEIVRIERASWQYEVARNYERILQKQVHEIETAKEIKKLNLQLESRNEFLYRIFGKYFSDEILEVILTKEEDELIGGEKREIAVMMSDLRGFTSITENMSADDMTDLLNCYFGAMVDIITKYKGTVIEYMGDGVLAVFGAPIKSEDYCANALAAAIEMQNAMKNVNSYCEKMGYESLVMGIGIHCGEGFVGNVGSEKMMRYNVLGSVVNICSRIEGCCVGGQVLASEELVRKIKTDVHIANSMQIFAKGISDMLNICSVTGIDGQYNCRLEKTKGHGSFIVKNNVSVELRAIQNKLVDSKLVPAVVKEISKEIIKVIMDEQTVLKHNLQLYGDVEVKVKMTDGGFGFLGGYAKITTITDGEMVLNWTRVTREYTEFYSNIKNGLLKGYSIWRQNMEEKKIKLLEINGEDWDNSEYFKENHKGEYILAWSACSEDVRIGFYNGDNYIRALEFIDYLAGEYGLAKGDKESATTVISKLFMKVMMTDMEVQSINGVLEKIIEGYYTQCQWIFAAEYVECEKETILNMKRYVKKAVPWACVKTTDIISAGEKFKLKSLENESNMIFEASDDMYIMIGCRGEIYNISKEKFQVTYELTDEKFDIFTQMPDFIPEVQLYEDKSYISLDDKAYMCYPKNANSIYAKELTCRTKVYSEHNKGEYYVGRKGDYLAVRADDLTDIYIIQRDIFNQTYETLE